MPRESFGGGKEGGPTTEEVKPQHIDDEQKEAVLEKVLDIASSSEYAVGDQDEEKWLKKLQGELKKIDLVQKYSLDRIPAEYGSYALPADKIGALLQEKDNRIFAALYTGDKKSAEQIIAQTHSLLSGVRKINERGEKIGGCICDECADLGRLAGAMGFKDLASRIRYNTVCPDYSTNGPTYLEDYFRHDKTDFPTTESYEKEVNNKLHWYAHLPQAKARLHEMYKEEINIEQQEKEKNPQLNRYLEVVKQYNETLDSSYRAYSFDGNAGNVRVFPGERIQLPEGKLAEGDVAEYLREADNNFFNFDLSVYPRHIPLGEKSEYGQLYHAGSADFVDLPDDKREEILAGAQKEYEELKSKPNTQRSVSEHYWIEEERSRANRFSLISALFARGGDSARAKEALNLARKANADIGRTDYYMAQGAGERNLALALAEIANGLDPSASLEEAEDKYMTYIGGFESSHGIGPTVRMHGLQNVAKVKVLVGSDPLPTLSKLDTIQNRISGVTKASVDAFEVWSKIRTMRKELGSQES